MDFAVYIDESGEAGVAKVRQGDSPGASPYFVLGAVALNPSAEILTRQVIEDFRSTIGKQSWKHATELGHPEKVLLARTLGALPVRYFSLISNKATLGEYREMIQSDPQMFYNKCLKYLLEKICSYLGLAGAKEENIRVVLERRNHDYDRMLRYLSKVKEKPIYAESKALKILNPFSISHVPKGEEPLLEIADFVAHATYQLGNKSKLNYMIPEPRYFSELSSRFACAPNGRILDFGIKCIHTLEQLRFDADITELLKKSRARLPTKRG